ncbi:hypothetical protein AWC30_07050 [Mycolicibacillus trivialis]|uniref:Uncharacterized protein n=2 Tax=Mycolicibacillus trivialis TaxID=1798 RepID=A0A1X2EM15_9MYCO|nr:hypothetical protein [Mycolicibacillus trivialis]ORX06156.1 hypothetical protein AWC30_07050 [Mycolicibacillus trivialis]
MDLVLGVALTGEQARWVTVDGTGAGATLDHGVVDADDADALEALVGRAQWRAIGLTWSPDAAAAAAEAQQVLGRRAAVTALAHDDAIGLLTAAIADVAGYDFLAVCNAEPDAAAVAVVNARRMTVEAVDAPDAESRIDRLTETVRGIRPSPDAVFVLGSAGTEALADRLRQVTTQPVLNAAEGEFALPRGAALAAARAADDPVAEPAAPTRRGRRAPALMAAAAVLLVVAVALGATGRLSWRTEEPPASSQAGQQTVRPSPPPAASPTAAPAPLAAPGNGAPEVAPVAPEQPQSPPEQAGSPEAPAEVPPAPPAEAPPAEAPPAEPPPVQAPPPAAEPVYVPPPPAPPPEPRLRDRIMDKIPGLDRFR